ncbi:DUF4838 domain-containing protein [Dysgonomonas sp. 520]|uniref:DUF4838 domain-containing protein n=1 Tax=Dysgonomonas sp. 520 TaxID=2302931 RepID=UPI0013D62A00|nr:DUF4838 domain-containing protein [Dysgonomonas sp. 520]
MKKVKEITETYIAYIYNYMSTFRNNLKYLFLLIILSACCSCGADNKTPSLNSLNYNVIFEENTVSEKWGNYVFNHLSKRSKEKGIVHLQNSGNGDYKAIMIEVDKNLEYDYCVEHIDKQIVLKAKTEEAIIWLIYQFMKCLSDSDDRFIADDLPPAIINFHTHCANFDFNYREPYFSPNTDTEYAAIIGTNVLDKDWGIWGHNLHQALKGNRTGEFYVKGTYLTEEEQYCFSNNKLFKHVKEYISDNFGNDKKYTQRFMIMPNDNNIVCNCDLCLSKGNTKDSATPALSFLIKRLAQEFPHHSFFTSAYLTTKSPPEDKWPANTGVMISTIDMPKGIELSEQQEVKEFLKRLNQWKACTSNIYTWDYAANFDDYLTPLPVLYGLRDQLRFHKSNGITGIFLNASGYDYSPFDDVKTFVAASLMINNDLSVDSLCERYLTQFYPKSGKLISDYYLSLEKRMNEQGKPYNIYGGFNEALDTYLNADDFCQFYDSLSTLIYTAGEEEKKKLERLYTALSYTRLQIAYYQGASSHGFATAEEKSMVVKPDIKTICEQLSHYKAFEGLSAYKEKDGNLESYLRNWRNIHDGSPLLNLLLNEPISTQSTLDEDYDNIQIINDGKLGFAEEYHQGWLIYSGNNLHLQFKADDVKNSTKISIRFLINERHHIYPPVRVEIYKDDKIYKNITPVRTGNKLIAGINENINFSDAEYISIRIVGRGGAKSAFACDEIQLN